MKLPRWVIGSLIAIGIFTALAASVSLWLAWPQRTARDFVGLIRAGKFEEATAFGHLQAPEDTRLLFAWEPEHKRSRFDEENLSAQPRSIGDLVLGRQAVTVPT